MAIGFGMFLSLFGFLTVTTCYKLQYPPLSTRIVEKNEEALSTYVMTEELQLEIQIRLFATDWSSLERIAQFLKAEYVGKTKLAVAKHVAQQLEEGIGKLEGTEVVPYLEGV